MTGQPDFCSLPYEVAQEVAQKLVEVGQTIHLPVRTKYGFDTIPDFRIVPQSLQRYYQNASREQTQVSAIASGPLAPIDPHAIVTEADTRSQNELTIYVERERFVGTTFFGEEKREVWKHGNEPTLQESIVFKQEEKAFYGGYFKRIAWLGDMLDGTLLFRTGGTDFAIMLGLYDKAQITDAWVHFPARTQRHSIRTAVAPGDIYIDNRLAFQRAAGEVTESISLGIHFSERLPQDHKDHIRSRFAKELGVTENRIVEEYHMGPGLLHYTQPAGQPSSTSAVLFWSQGPDGDKDRNWSNKPWDTMPYDALTQSYGGMAAGVLEKTPYKMAPSPDAWYPAEPILFAKRPDTWETIAKATNAIHMKYRK